ncbi:MAG: hypothetical protein RL348_212, partial [Bacteroidota bacterium]
ISVFVLGWLIGTQVLLLKLRRAFLEEAERRGIVLDDDDEDEEVPTFFTELDNGTIFVYNKENSAFICQAPSLEEAASKCNVRVAKVLHDKALFVFVNGKVKPVPQ